MTKAARLFTASAFVVLISLAGCATKSGAETQQLRPLENAELVKLFADSVLVPEGGSSGSQVYYADGRYTFDHGWRIWGTYTIENNEVCVIMKTNKVPFCTRYARDESGQVFQVASRLGDEEARRGPPFPSVSFHPFCTDPEKVPPLSEAELKRVFPGSVMSDVTGGSYEETFFADGRHRTESERAVWSTYTIAGNEVCVVRENRGAPHCRRFTKDAEGKIFWLFSEPGKDRCMKTPTQFTFRAIDVE